MALPYEAALEMIDAKCADLLKSILDPSLLVTTRVNLRERRDYWHVIGSRIRRRMAREAGRQALRRCWSSNSALVDPNAPSMRRFDR